MQEAISVSATRNRSRCAARGQAVKRLDSYGHRATAAVGSIFFKYTYRSNSRCITTLCGIAEGRCGSCGNYRAADICELRGRFYRCVGTNLAYPCCDLSRKPLLAETRNNIGDLVLRICIDDNGGSKCRAVVHTHVERSVMNIRKAALGCVELI